MSWEEQQREELPSEHHPGYALNFSSRSCLDAQQKTTGFLLLLASPKFPLAVHPLNSQSCYVLLLQHSERCGSTTLQNVEVLIAKLLTC
jgi:hypothetical protein